MQRIPNPAGQLEAFGRVRTRPVLILRAKVAPLDGELVDSATGVILTSEEAYETVYGPVKEEPLGTV